MPVAVLEQALVDALVTHLDGAIVQEAIAAVIESLSTTSDSARLEALRRELAETERKLANLTAAIAEGGDVPALVTSLKAHDDQRRLLTTQIRTLTDQQVASLDRRQLEQHVRGRISGLRETLTSGNRASARNLLRRFCRPASRSRPQPTADTPR